MIIQSESLEIKQKFKESVDYYYKELQYQRIVHLDGIIYFIIT